MRLFLVWDLLLLPFIVRYCVASDSNIDLPPESGTTSSSISLPEEIFNGNPASATGDPTNLQREQPSPDHPFDIGESVELLSQSKSDSCVPDKNQAPGRRLRFRRDSCPSQFISPDAARKNPVTIPSIPTWGSDIPAPKRVPFSGVVREDRALCVDDWQNVPVCAPESFAEGDYLPSCRLRMPFCKDDDILFCCGFVALAPWWTIGTGMSREQILNLKYPYYGLQCLSVGGLI